MDVTLRNPLRRLDMDAALAPSSLNSPLGWLGEDRSMSHTLLSPALPMENGPSTEMDPRHPLSLLTSTVLLLDNKRKASTTSLRGNDLTQDDMDAFFSLSPAPASPSVLSPQAKFLRRSSSISSPMSPTSVLPSSMPLTVNVHAPQTAVAAPRSASPKSLGPRMPQRIKDAVLSTASKTDNLHAATTTAQDRLYEGKQASAAHPSIQRLQKEHRPVGRPKGSTNKAREAKLAEAARAAALGGNLMDSKRSQMPPRKSNNKTGYNGKQRLPIPPALASAARLVAPTQLTGVRAVPRPPKLGMSAKMAAIPTKVSRDRGDIVAIPTGEQAPAGTTPLSSVLEATLSLHHDVTDGESTLIPIGKQNKGIKSTKRAREKKGKMLDISVPPAHDGTGGALSPMTPRLILGLDQFPALSLPSSFPAMLSPGDTGSPRLYFDLPPLSPLMPTQEDAVLPAFDNMAWDFTTVTMGSPTTNKPFYHFSQPSPLPQ